MHAFLRRYGLALLIVLLAAAIRYTLVPFLGYRFAYTLFLVGTYVSGRFLGLGPSLVTLLVGAVPAVLFHMASDGEHFDRPFQAASILYFVLGLVLVALCNSEHRVRRALQREIANRRVTEGELRDSRQQLLLAMEAGRLGSWQVDMHTGKVTWSASMEAVHGVAHGTFGGTLAESMANVHPDDAVRIEQILKDGPESSRMTYRILTPDGQTRWIEGFGQTLRDERGRPTQMVGVCSDITERMEGELALRQAEERFRVLATHAPVGIFQTDAEGRCLFVNEAWCSVAGAKPDEPLDLGWTRFVHPDDQRKVFTIARRSLRHGRSFVTPFRFLHGQSGVRYAVGSASAIHSSTGALRGYVGTVVDVTERQLAEDIVRASEARLQGILDNTTAVIYLKDLEGRYLLVNRRWMELFGMRDSDVAGRTAQELYPKDVAATLLANDRTVIETGEPLEVEETVPQADGLHTYITVKFPIRDAAGRIAAVGGISTDITDRIKALENLEAEQELLRHTILAQDQQRQLVTYEIHDGLVQYATVALMQLESIRDDVTSAMLATQLDNVLSVLRKTVNEGRRIINGLHTPVLDDCGVVAAVQQLIEEEERAHVQVEFVADDNLGRMAPNIEAAVYHVTQEALTNVYKHSRSQKVRVELARRGDRVHLEVRDWGVGFDLPERPRGVHGLRSMNERRRIAGGCCTIASATGSGTQIILDLPYLTNS